MPDRTTRGRSFALYHSTPSTLIRYLRTLGAYEGAKKGYEFCRGFVGVRTIAPVVEWVAEGTLAKLPVIKHLKDEETADGYPVLHGIDNRLAEMLQHFDDYVRRLLVASVGGSVCERCVKGGSGCGFCWPGFDLTLTDPPFLPSLFLPLPAQPSTAGRERGQPQDHPGSGHPDHDAFRVRRGRLDACGGGPHPPTDD